MLGIEFVQPAQSVRWPGATAQQPFTSGTVRGRDAHRRIDREAAAVLPSRHLGLDYIDIYCLHRDEPDATVGGTVAVLGEVIRGARTRSFGLSNYRDWRIAQLVNECLAQGVPPPVVCDPYYSLLNRMPDVEMLPACDHFGLGVAPYSPMVRGVLTGKCKPGGPAPDDSRAAVRDSRLLETEFREESFTIAQTLAQHAAKTGRTPTQFGLAWLWANRIVSSVIAGPRTLLQWQDYLAVVGTEWNADDEALVDSLVKPGHPSTPGYTDPRYPATGRVTRFWAAPRPAIGPTASS